MLVEKGNLKYDVNLQDRPVFKFGNGHTAQALSRVDLKNTSIGDMSFYVLGNEAHRTPPLMGGKTLRKLGALLAYEDDLFIYKSQEPQVMWHAVKMYPHTSAHVSIDMVEVATPMKSFHAWFSEQVQSHDSTVAQVDTPVVAHETVFMMSTLQSTSQRQDRLSNQARKLQSLRDQVCDGHSSSSLCGRRSSSPRVSMLQSTSSQGEAKPVCQLDSVPGMRTAPVVYHQEAGTWRGPSHGASSKLGQLGHGTTSGQRAQGPSDREDLQRQVDGAEGFAASARHDQYPGSESDLCPVHQTDGLGCGAQVKEQAGTQGNYATEDCGEGPREDAGSSCRLSQGEWPRQLGSQQVCGDSPKCREEGDGSATIQLGWGRCGDRLFGRRERSEFGSPSQEEGDQQGSIGGKMMSMWSSMARLREKMKLSGRDGHTSQDTTNSIQGSPFDVRPLNEHGIPDGRDGGANFEGSRITGLAPLPALQEPLHFLPSCVPHEVARLSFDHLQD